MTITHTHTARTVLRLKAVLAESGYSRSTLYLRIADGTFTKPIPLGERMVGWPASEVAAINGARIARHSDSDIRALVKTLELARVEV
jgi:prophage regulatory protein